MRRCRHAERVRRGAHAGPIPVHVHRDVLPVYGGRRSPATPCAYACIDHRTRPLPTTLSTPQVTKAICDSAAGGMVLASEHCLHQLLPLLPLLDSQPPLAVYCGSVEVSGLRFPSVMHPSTVESTAHTASGPILSLMARVRRVLPIPTRDGSPEGQQQQQQQQQPVQAGGASADGGLAAGTGTRAGAASGGQLPAAGTGTRAGTASGGQLPAGWGAALSVGIGVGAARGATSRPPSGGVGVGVVGSGGGAGGSAGVGGGNGGGGAGAGDTCVPRRSAAVYQLVSRQLRQRLPHMAPLRRVTFTQVGTPGLLSNVTAV